MSIQLSKRRKEQGKLWYMMFGSECHIENCINATRRLYHILDAVKTEKKCGGKLSLNRQMRKILEAQSKEIIDVRDGVEHIDDIIQKSEVTGPIVLSISDDEEGIELAGYYVRFVDLALVLNRFHELAKQWLDDFCREAT
jgi:hypothetical protein